MNHTVLKAEKINKSFGRFNILREINLELKKGEAIAIMGASGEGKTTLLHILGGLETASQGIVYINGREISAKNAALIRNAHIGFIFQTYNLLEELSVFDNVAMPAKIARNYGVETKSRIANLLKEVGMNDKENFLAKFLSGGEKQRTAIARSFCNNPDIILADEPSGNLDHINSKNIHSLLLSFAKEKNKSLIIATHDSELAGLCDKIYVLKEGCLIS